MHRTHSPKAASRKAETNSEPLSISPCKRSGTFNLLLILSGEPKNPSEHISDDSRLLQELKMALRCMFNYRLSINNAAVAEAVLYPMFQNLKVVKVTPHSKTWISSLYVPPTPTCCSSIQAKKQMRIWFSRSILRIIMPAPTGIVQVIVARL